MKLFIVAVRDLAVQSYQNPFFVQHNAAAVRAFRDEVVKTDGNALALHPEDYELHALGLFDPEKGEFSSEGVDVLLRGKDAVQLK